MSGAADIEDEESLRNWLEGRPREDAVIIAHRAAMRVAPVYWRWTVQAEENFGGIGQFQRSLLVTHTASAGLSPEIEKAARSAVRAATQQLAAPPEMADAARNAATSASFAVDEVAFVARAAAAANAASIACNVDVSAVDDFAQLEDVTGHKQHVAFWNCVTTDCIILESAQNPHRQALWHQKLNPTRQGWQTTRAAWAARGPEWQFWIDWYEDALAGREPNWELLRDIALIAPETWDAGPDAVNAEIMRITEKHSLLEEIRALKAERARLVENAAAQAHRGHNEPPELIDAPREVARELTVVWASLDDAERELEKPHPDLSRLQSIANALKAAVGQVAAYLGKVGDRFVMAGVTVFGSGAGTVALDHFFTNGRLMDLAAWLLRFSGGG